MTDRTANLLGALALAVTDRIEAIALEVVNHAGQSPAALVVIGYGPGLSNDKLRRILRLSHSATVRLIDRLIAEGLVERRAGRTRRDVALYLTDSGVKARADLLQGRLAAVGIFLSPLSSSEEETFATLVHTLLSSLKTEEMDRYNLCRLCDDRVCLDCPLPTQKGASV